jgi:hypothetical protein
VFESAVDALPGFAAAATVQEVAGGDDLLNARRAFALWGRRRILRLGIAVINLTEGILRWPCFVDVVEVTQHPSGIQSTAISAK